MANIKVTSKQDAWNKVNQIFPTDYEQDVDEWMLSGITAMMDRANEMKIIPYDLPTSICGLLCAQYR